MINKEWVDERLTYVFTEQNEAEDVLERLQMFCNNYKFASVADFFESLGVEVSFADYRYGWRNVDEVKIQEAPVVSSMIPKHSRMYVLSLPKPEAI